MTLSADDRRSNMVLALRLLLDHIPADRPYEWELVDTDTADFADTYPTTWRELERLGYVKAFSFRRYRLTPEGWIQGLKATGEFESEDLRQKAGKLSKALKDRIKGRSDDELVIRTDLAKETGLPDSWIYNAIDSHLLFHLFGRRDAHWASGDQMKNTIEIPIDFGLPDLPEVQDRDQHNGPWKCDRCGTFVGMLLQMVVTDTGVEKSFKCDCGGEFWPAT